ncbi:MAG: UDP-N-acetylmuramoyl-L-alanine--D-glutamate ligase [Clostridiales Family XIII bacterium]|jgi:UDP-N-acetylmuramoylalanine--D-glutamate ligase|nr:UDP-N-acetylmuramoyl-L-alanine--D-glutamate ligase [Clostridiales Family XIII bacterium]
MVDFKGKKILIAGVGKSGTAAFEALFHSGALPSVYDDKDIEWEIPKLFAKLSALDTPMYFNGKPVPDEAWDFVISSPGVPLDLPFMRAAARRGAEIIGELELSYLLGRGLYAAITGTNGKTTTTALTGEIFKNAGRDTVVAGNIGIPVLPKALKAADDTWLITEVSSFQLETTRDFHPKISAFLNLTPDHMDRHKTMERYGAAKARIFANQGAEDYFIYNADDESVSKLAAGSRAKNIPFSRKHELQTGVFTRGGRIIAAAGGQGEIDLLGEDELTIPGKHNLENALAAAAIACAAGIKPNVIGDSIRHFRGVEHRLELAATIGGVRFVNDSKGTNPEAAVKALEAVGEGIILIAGGYDKKADFGAFAAAARGKVRTMLLLGETAEKIRAAAALAGIADIQVVHDLGEAVRLGFELAEPGDTVLLSPACASWDMYTDFEERGKHFKQKVEELRK